MSAPIFSVASIRAIEARFLPDTPLMERAGRAAADLALTLIGDSTDPVLILAGPGNNGGDAQVVARHLRAAGRKVLLPTIGEPLPAGPYALAIDGLFGIGLTRPIMAPYADWIATLNTLPFPVLALDVPSGLDADTGQQHGPSVRASHTITFIALKPGLLTLDGPDCCGEIHVADLDLPVAEFASDATVLGPDLFAHHLAPRLRNSHKGSHGSVGILGGAPGMMGAALLAGRAALKLGAGRVYVGLLEPISVDAGQPELMLRQPGAVTPLATALAVGPGLGQSNAAADLLRQAIDAPLPLVIDADGLNLLAAHPTLARGANRRSAPLILTPHPAEAARLLNTDVATIQANRLAAARELARRFNASVVLKGCGSIVAHADGRCQINTSGNPGLASAGSGDVLTGFAVALLAQGWPADAALATAVHLHGAAADALVDDGVGPVGLTAGELIEPARRLLNAWIADARA
ncbi:MAG: NAD(P)H-hydrate dehydratase [Rhodocyclaceae bacterium]|nr:NAD(P)H-hydrate dehydratase [Rhodocyclaceae bacterium]